MQLLFDASDEGEGAGLGSLAGQVRRLDARRVPQIGWNALEYTEDPVFESAPCPTSYYANSSACRPNDTACVVAWSTHESDPLPAAVRRGRTLGVQFHPEKSSRAGVAFLSAWLAEAAR
jgi:glutamine amidotransferase